MRSLPAALALLLLATCGPPPPVKEPPPPCPFSPQMRRVLPMAADFVYGLTFIGVNESSSRNSIPLGRSLMSFNMGGTSTLALFDECASPRALPLICRDCIGSACPSPAQCTQIECLGDGGTKADAWVAVDGGYEYRPVHPGLQDAQLRYSADPHRVVERRFEGNTAVVSVSVNDAVSASLEGTTVDLSFTGSAQGRVQGANLLNYTSRAQLPAVLPGRRTEVRAEKSASSSGIRVSIELDGEEMAHMLNFNEALWNGACGQDGP